MDEEQKLAVSEALRRLATVVGEYVYRNDMRVAHKP